MKKKNDSILRSVRMDASLAEIITAQAEKENRSFNNMVVTLIKQAIQGSEQKGNK